jgi:DMSO/TMAO reductase YedYZ heme-binding membrane subunit
MFTLALIHSSWVRLFLYINLKYIPTLSDFSTFEICGILGFTLLIPLFITSNSFSVRTLKKNWHRIHYLIYGTMWLIAFHVALQGEWQWAIPTYIIAILQLLSRINEYKLKKAAAQMAPAQPSAQASTSVQPQPPVEPKQQPQTMPPTSVT